MRERENCVCIFLFHRNASMMILFRWILIRLSSTFTSCLNTYRIRYSNSFASSVRPLFRNPRKSFRITAYYTRSASSPGGQRVCRPVNGVGYQSAFERATDEARVDRCPTGGQGGWRGVTLTSDGKEVPRGEFNRPIRESAVRLLFLFLHQLIYPLDSSWLWKSARRMEQSRGVCSCVWSPRRSSVASE